LVNALSPRVGAVVTAVVAVASLGGVVPVAQAAPTQPAAVASGLRWGSASSATIHPGVRVSMAGVTCVAGFVFTDGTHAFLGVPGGCTGAGQVDNSKCDAGQVPYGLKVAIAGAHYKGTLVYSSVTEMELRSEQRTNVCKNNSLSLVRLDRRDIKRTNPSVPALGGPTGVANAQPAAPDQLEVYLGAPTMAQAVSSGSSGWAHTLMVDGPVSATSVGAVVLTSDGKALGMVTTTPDGGGGQIIATDLRLELRYLHKIGKFADVQLARGTKKFAPALPLVG
jgi:hypothetical protein